MTDTVKTAGTAKAAQPAKSKESKSETAKAPTTEAKPKAKPLNDICKGIQERHKLVVGRENLINHLDHLNDMQVDSSRIGEMEEESRLNQITLIDDQGKRYNINNRYLLQACLIELKAQVIARIQEIEKELTK